MWAIIILLTLLADALAAWATIEWFQRRNLKKAIILYIATVVTLTIMAVTAYMMYNATYNVHTE